MAKILIIGGGFSGLSAAGRLSRLGMGAELTLIDKRQNLDFLPMLPDCLGRGIRPRDLAYDIERQSRRLKFKFIKDQVTAVDLQKKEVSAASGTFGFDYLIIASGAETNFFGNSSFKESAYGLVSVSDAERLTGVLAAQSFDNFIVAGGGYTGVEAAANLQIRLNKSGRPGRVTIVEKAPHILNNLPEWMRSYAEDNLRYMGIDILGGSAIEKIEGRCVTVSQELRFDNALVVWAAGARAAAFIKALDAGKSPQGRIEVDEYLRVNENCFAAGDAAYFCKNSDCLRMAVQFSLAQGRCAAENVFRLIKGKKPRRFRPIDLGYVIPMANNRSCGVILGMELKGFLPTLLHYLMCVYRLPGVSSKAAVLRQLLKRP